MTQKEKMLHMVLNNERLMSSFNYTMDEVEELSFHDALYCDNAIIAGVAKIIDELKGSYDASTQKTVYKKVFQFFNTHLLA